MKVSPVIVGFRLVFKVGLRLAPPGSPRSTADSFSRWMVDPVRGERLARQVCGVSQAETLHGSAIEIRRATTHVYVGLPSGISERPFQNELRRRRKRPWLRGRDEDASE